MKVRAVCHMTKLSPKHTGQPTVDGGGRSMLLARVSGTLPDDICRTNTLQAITGAPVTEFHLSRLLFVGGSVRHLGLLLSCDLVVATVADCCADCCATCRHSSSLSRATSSRNAVSSTRSCRFSASNIDARTATCVHHTTRRRCKKTFK